MVGFRSGESMHSRLHAIAATLVLTLALAGGAFAQSAQNYPDHPVRVIISFTPGGGTDVVGRIVAKAFQDVTGQPMVFEYKPGAAEQIGTAFAAKAPADGYTILMIGNSFSINPALYPSLPYDTVKDFIPLTLLGIAPFAFLVNPDVHAKSMQELAALARSEPAKLNYGSMGSGSPQQLSIEWFKKMANADIVAVPYKGLAPAMLAGMTGEVQLVVAGLASALPHMKSGKLRALAVTTGQRTPVAPELPTMIEAGFPGFETFAWYGMAVPAGTPPEIVSKLNAQLARALQSPALIESFKGIGVEAKPMSVSEFGQFVRKDMDLWGRLVKMINAKPD